MAHASDYDDASRHSTSSQASSVSGRSVKPDELLEAAEVLETRVGEVPVMTSSEASRALEDDLAYRQRVLDAALRPKPFAVLLGASNMPHDCSIWAPDWRERLPRGHPERVKAERADNLRKAGTPAARKTIRSAHKALLASARRTNNAGAR